MKVLVAPDKFKGSLTAVEAAEHIARGIRRALPHADVHCQPVADGGEGTVDAVVAAGMTRHEVTVSGPLGAPVRAEFALGQASVEDAAGPVAVVELAQASGLQFLGGHLEPLRATSRATGELLLAAAAAGARTIVLAVGGSACTDGGAGMLAALGARFTGADGALLPDGGGALVDLADADLTGARAALDGVRLVLASDVDNPLLGPRGASQVYGPQKGAGPADVELLERGLGRLADVLGAEAARIAEVPGAGAAGGVGFGAILGLGAVRRPGFEVIAELVHFDDALDGVELVVTGEGSLDVQTLHGKAPVAVAGLAANRGIPVLALCGVLRVERVQLAQHGIGQVRALTELEPDPARCIANAGELLERLAGSSVA